MIEAFASLFIGVVISSVDLNTSNGLARASVILQTTCQRYLPNAVTAGAHIGVLRSRVKAFNDLEVPQNVDYTS